MPILIQIDSCLGKGSTGRITESIGLIMKRLGWDCYVVHGDRYAGETKLESMKTVSRVQEYLHALGSILFDRHGLFSSSQTRRIMEKVRDMKPDIIQLHCVHGYYINYEILFEFLHGMDVPVVWTFHDCWAFTAQCSHFTIEKCDKWKTGCHHCPQYRNYPSAYVDVTEKMWKLKKEWFTGVPDMTVATPSSWLAGLIGESYLKDYPVKVINNGIDLSVFKPSESDFRKRLGLEDKTKKKTQR